MPTASESSPRLAVGGLIIMLLLVSLVPAVSAEIITGHIYEIKTQFEDIDVGFGLSGSSTSPYSWRLYYDPLYRQIPTDIHIFDTRLGVTDPNTFHQIPNYRVFYCNLTDADIKVADVKIEYIKNDFIEPNIGLSTVVINFYNWNYDYLDSLTKWKSFRFTDIPVDSTDPTFYIYVQSPPSNRPNTYLHQVDTYRFPVSNIGYITNYYEVGYFEQSYTISTDDYGTDINIVRVFDDEVNPSKIKVTLAGSVIFESDYISTDQNYSFPYHNLTVDIIDTEGRVYRILDDGGTPGTPPPVAPPTPVTVYVRNSQTGNLLAGSHIIISASVGGEFHEVVNQTLPGGHATYTLQPTGGGLPNPDYYRLIATADGYNPYMPYIDFELDRPTNLIVMMEPITGGPVDENKTFIEFYVRDMAANPISGATVTCGPYSLITNSAGYTQFEMPINANYPYSVSKSGYVTIEGRVTVGDGPRYTVNVVLGPKEIPTNPPATDPGGPGATPTPDRRTNEEKGQAVIDMIADNAEGIGALALICLLMGLLKLMAKW